MAEKKSNINEETQQKIQEVQMLEQNVQGLLMQKQAFQMELNETENALSEIKDTKDDVFKMIGQIMIKTNKEGLVKDLKQKKDLLSLRMKSIEGQEKQLANQLEELRKEIMKEIR